MKRTEGGAMEIRDSIEWLIAAEEVLAGMRVTWRRALGRKQVKGMGCRALWSELGRSA